MAAGFHPPYPKMKGDPNERKEDFGAGKISRRSGNEDRAMMKQERDPMWSRIAGRLTAAAVTLGCLLAVSVNGSHGEEKMALAVYSDAFGNRGDIPVQYTCQGRDLSPPLNWEGVPEQTSSLVLIVDDPDAPDPKAPKMTWVHWVLYNIPPDATGLPENVQPGELPSATEEGLNDWGRTGYGGPCPPIGRHRYFHKLYALDTIFEGLKQPTKAQIESAMKGHVIAQAELIGTYQKSR